jgi:ribonuclease J
MHTGDFKIDMTPEIDEPANLSRIGAFGKKGVTLLMSDSTASLRKGHSMSEKNV